MTQNSFLRLHFGHGQEPLGRVKSGNNSSGVRRCPEEPYEYNKSRGRHTANVQHTLRKLFPCNTVLDTKSCQHTRTFKAFLNYLTILCYGVYYATLARSNC